MPKHRKLPEHTPDRVRDFIKHMLAGQSAREAAAAAGFERSQAGALCGKPEVRAALQREPIARDQVLRHTPAGIEGQMGFQAFSDPAAMFAPDGSLLPIAQMPAEVRASIASFEHHRLEGPNGYEHVVSKIRLTPRQPPLRDLAQMHGMLAAEQPLINAPAFNITINCEPPPGETDDEPALEVPRRHAADGSAAPPAGSYQRGGLIEGQVQHLDGPPMDPTTSTPELDGQRMEAAAPDDQDTPPPGLTLRERLSWAQARAARRMNERIDAETRESTKRGQAQDRRRRQPFADGLD